MEGGRKLAVLSACQIRTPGVSYVIVTTVELATASHTAAHHLTLRAPHCPSVAFDYL